MAVSSTGSFWSWSYRWLEGVWELKLGLRQEQYLLLATEPSLSPIIITVNVKDGETIWSSNFTQVVTQKNWGPALRWSPLELRHYCKRLRGEKTPSVYQCVSGYVKYLVWWSITLPSTKETARVAMRWGNCENTLFNHAWWRSPMSLTLLWGSEQVHRDGWGNQLPGPEKKARSVWWTEYWSEGRQEALTWHVSFDVSERTCDRYENLIYCISIWLKKTKSKDPPHSTSVPFKLSPYNPCSSASQPRI